MQLQNHTIDEILIGTEMQAGDRPEYLRYPPKNSKCPITSLMSHSLDMLTKPGDEGEPPLVRSFTVKINPLQKRGIRLIWYPALLAYLYEKPIEDFPTPIRPEFIKIAQSPQRCPWTGLSHGSLFNLVTPNERNGLNPPVKSRSLRKRGATKGTRIVFLESLLGYLHEQMDANSDDWSWSKACIAMNRASGRPPQNPSLN
jgi:hypothetical protein